MSPEVYLVCVRCNKLFRRPLRRLKMALKKGIIDFYCSKRCVVGADVPLEERFWPKVDKTPGLGPNGDCWEWLGAINKVNGYGYFKNPFYKSEEAHIVSFCMANPNKDIKGLCVCHSCDNRKCVNPSHLWLGTYKDNCQDKVKKGRHTLGSRCPTAILNEEQIKTLRDLYATGNYTMESIANIYGLKRRSIGDIINRKTWRHVPC